MRVLICGSRNWKHKGPIKTYLDGLHKAFGDALVIIEGGADGADRIAGEWAIDNEVEHLIYEADWETHGKSAGPVRNEKMLKEGKPDLVLGFKSGFDWFFQRGGTEHMINIAGKAGVPTYVISKNEYG